MTQEHILYILLIAALTASIVVQVIVSIVLRELFYYMRGSHKGLYDRIDYVVGGVEVLKEQHSHLHKRVSELFRIISARNDSEKDERDGK